MTDTIAKLTKEGKEQLEGKKKLAKTSNDWNWKPLATDLAITATKACITALVFKFSGQIYDYSFNRKINTTTLALLDGGKKSHSA